jgi:hypothetical protein
MGMDLDAAEGHTRATRGPRQASSTSASMCTLGDERVHPGEGSGNDPRWCPAAPTGASWPSPSSWSSLADAPSPLGAEAIGPRPGHWR